MSSRARRSVALKALIEASVSSCSRLRRSKSVSSPANAFKKSRTAADKLGDRAPAEFSRRIAAKRAVHAVLVVVSLERRELLLQVDNVPEQHVVEVLSADGPDQPLYEGMRLVAHTGRG